jgi:hypothetical protein
MPSEWVRLVMARLRECGFLEGEWGFGGFVLFVLMFGEGEVAKIAEGHKGQRRKCVD